MQAGGGCSDRALLVREQGLVVGAVAFVRRAARGDVGRQRRVAERAYRLVEIGAVKAEGEPNASVRLLRLDRRFQRAEQADAALVAEADAIAHFQAPSRFGESPPSRAVDPLEQRDANLNRRRT